MSIAGEVATWGFANFQFVAGSLIVPLLVFLNDRFRNKEAK
ncbi:MAG: hypothetical protein AVDCRST_MAG68-548 [uncultured Gemmatimonadetes bacterium]|uniref:Uncharacterized protein n=1 Tax=uncultured Gemmatimonadota bacterium TaxID=203437 RepID=A0A6J4KA32_9BACT|nr:MAG: hypothetical protein AVDCRST_MAG68-548 [uncultured Gemmatimonadota bacterium]